MPMTTVEKAYQYFDHNPDLHVLFVFDNTILHGLESDLAAEQWRPGYRFVVFGGDWFNVKYALKHQWKDEKVILLFYGPEPSDQQARSEFYLMSELMANTVFSSEDYVTFMQENHISPDYKHFVRNHIGELQSSKYRKILAPIMSEFTPEKACRGFISGYLGQERLLDWEEIVMRVMILAGLEENGDKFATFFKRLRSNPDALVALCTRLSVMRGQEQVFTSAKDIQRFTEALKYNAITQSLPTAGAADDYRAYKIKDSMTLQWITSFLTQAFEHPTLGAQFKTAFDNLGQGILEDSIVNLYGAEADYPFVTEKLSWKILARMLQGDFRENASSINRKIRMLYLKCSKDTTISQVLDFLINACWMYEKIKDFGTPTLNSAGEYINRYVTDYYPIDMYYRYAVDAFYKIDQTKVPQMDDIEAVKKEMDAFYASHCNRFNLEWLRCAVEDNLDLSKAVGLHYQKDFYTENIEGAPYKQAVIISDALRYEVAVELMQEMSREKHTVRLEYTLAMLPSETKYCKTALLPHKEMSLNLSGDKPYLALDGEYDLGTLEKREAFAQKTIGDSVCVDYSKVITNSQSENRELFKHQLVYVFHDKIDDDSLDHNAKDVTHNCDLAVQELRRLISSIHATFNVNNIILTSDHGFLFNDIEFADKDKHSVKEESLEKKTRYYLTHSAEEQLGITKLPVNKVSGVGNDDIYVAVPNGTNRLAAPGGYIFAHGGASLQEIVVPVIFSSLKRKDKKVAVLPTILESTLIMTSSRLQCTIIQDRAVDSETRERTIVCAIYDGDVQVTEAKTITLDSVDALNLDNRKFKLDLMLNTPNTRDILELRIFEEGEALNPLLKKQVVNKTLIGFDF